MRAAWVVLWTVAMFVPWAATASAKDYANEGITRNEMLAFLRDQGLTATREPDWKGVPIIRTAADGVNFDVYFFDCESDEGRCRSMQFAAGWGVTNFPISSEALNRWNREKRWMRAYLTANSAVLYGEMDFMVSPNGSTDLLDRNLRLWRLLLTHFKTHFGLSPAV